MDWTLQTVFMGCAAVGGAVLVIQILFMLLGGGDFDGGFDDVDVDAGDGGLQFLSLQSLSAFLTFFGLTGWWASSATEWNDVLVTLVAALVGAAVMLLTTLLLRAQRKLNSEGNLDPAHAVGTTARVYLRVPGRDKGHGKITVTIQGRSAEYAAFTKGKELATGREVRVVRMTTPGTFEVEALDKE